LSKRSRRTYKANLTKYVATEAGLRYCPAVITPNGRIKQDIVLVNNKEERHPEGAYYLDWRAHGVRTRLSVGKNAVDAQTQCQRKTFELNAASHGVEVVQSAGQSNGHSNGHRPLAAAVTEYLEETRLSKKTKTHRAYSTTLNYFQKCCSKPCLEDIARTDMLKFAAFLRDEKNHGPRTVHNRFLHVLVFLKAQGIRGLVSKNDWPRYTQEEPEVFEREELDTLFAACNAEERLWFEFFLMTGMREQEVVHCCWKDVSWAAAVVRVTHKPEYDWTPKAYKEREIPVPTALVESLKAWKSKATAGCSLIFPAAGRPKQNFLHELKAIAERSGLDKDSFWLHKFRATFATWSLWNGVDLRTVQSWLGHSDLESTLRYLKPSRSQATRDKVNQTFSAGGSQ
jgi:integrase/recombinase XerD